MIKAGIPNRLKLNLVHLFDSVKKCSYIFQVVNNANSQVRVPGEFALPEKRLEFYLPADFSIWIIICLNIDIQPTLLQGCSERVRNCPRFCNRPGSRSG